MIKKTMFLPEQQPLINKEHKFIYQPLCKVGCKTIKTWMLSLFKKDVLETMSVEEFGLIMENKHMNTDFNIHDYVNRVFGYIKHSEDEHSESYKNLLFDSKYIELLDEDNFKFTNKINSYFKFTFVRNPWIRVVSAYLEKFRNPNGFTYKPAKVMNESVKNMKTHIDGDGIISFDGFVDILYQKQKVSYGKFDIHWLPQYVMNDMFVKNFDYIGKLENFENDFDKILKELDIKIKPKYKIGSNSHQFQKFYKFYENRKDLIDKVSEIYKEDIKRYDYKFTDLEK